MTGLVTARLLAGSAAARPRVAGAILLLAVLALAGWLLWAVLVRPLLAAVGG